MPTSQETADHEQRLPRVPLPTPELSVERFEQWCAPLLSAEELAATRDAAAAFLDPAGPVPGLQAELVADEARPGVHSWLDEFWRDRYLGRRDRIALNANFFFLFTDPVSGPADQLGRAATLLAAAVDHKLRIDRGLIEPELTRGRPQSMEQLRHLFCTTRIPGAERDTARTPYSPEWPGPAAEHHVIVFRRHHAFRLDVLAPDGRAYTVDELREGLRAVLADGDRPAEPGTAVGHLTTKARAAWAADRRALLDADPANAHALETIETALLCLSLEDGSGADTQTACDQLLHGDSGNRWFDKAVTVVVFSDGTAGVNTEHCELDGTAIINLTDALQTWTDPGGRPAEPGVPAHEPVRFALDDATRATITAAGEDFAAYAGDTATLAVTIEGFTSERAKALKTSPDAFAQLGYQLAHHRTDGAVGATYESIATRQYQNGRTEAMRVVTREVVEFVTAMADPGADDDTRRAAFRAAARAHVARAGQCQAGDAPEQHLWELQLRARRAGVDLGPAAALYDSPGWRIMREDSLSTSSMPSPRVRFFGFGSTSPSCIGVGYALLPDRYTVYLSTPRAVAARMHTFADELRAAVPELERLLAADLDD